MSPDTRGGACGILCDLRYIPKTGVSIYADNRALKICPRGVASCVTYRVLLGLGLKSVYRRSRGIWCHMRYGRYSLDAARAVRVKVLEHILQLILGPAHVGVAHAHLLVNKTRVKRGKKKD